MHRELPPLSPEGEKFKRRGNEYYKNGEYHLAYEYYGKALLEAPDSPALASNLSITALKLRSFEEALEYGEGAVVVSDSPRAATCNLVHSPSLLTLCQLDPKWDRAYLRVAQAREALGS